MSLFYMNRNGSGDVKKLNENESHTSWKKDYWNEKS